jgi:putative acyl-CoA dehydrogenase
MRNLLADMCVEADAHAMTALRLAKAYDEDKSGRNAGSPETEEEAAFFRMGVAIGKYWITKRLPNFTFEAMEVCDAFSWIEGRNVNTIRRRALFRFTEEMGIPRIFPCLAYTAQPR